MKKRWFLCVILTLCILVGTLCPAAFAVEGEQSCHGLQAQQALDGSNKKLDTAKVVLLYELHTKTLVYSYNADKQINPTGLVKLLTVLVALEKGNLDDMVKVYQATLNTVAVGSVSAKLKSGEEMTLRDLLYCIMVYSANDACAVVAAHIGGSQEGFAEMLNAKATELGCTGSHFTNAHGLNDPDQYSTARDLAVITLAALENPLFSEMFSITEYTVEATNKSDARNLKSTNHMMRQDKPHYDARVTGGKPAAASNTDRSMICTARVGNAEYLCVVMNVKGAVSDNNQVILRYGIYEEMTALLDYASNGFEVRQILDDSQAMYQYSVTGGENAVILRPSADVFVVLPKDCNVEKLTFDHTLVSQTLTAPIALGQGLGTLTIRYGNLVMGTCDLLAVAAVASAGTTIKDAPRLDVPDNNGGDLWKTVFGYAALVLIGAAVLIVLIVVIVRAVRSGKIRSQQRRRARNHKRSR